MNITLKEREGVYSSRTWILSAVDGWTGKGLPEELDRRVRANLRDLIRMLEWNAENRIWVMRLSSDLFPHYTNLRHTRYNMDDYAVELRAIGDCAKRLGIRLNFHPGQYDVVGSPDEDVFESTARDLDFHAEIFERMGIGADGTMVVHGGGVYGDKSATIARWVENFGRLSRRAQERLVIENCERLYSIYDCLEISRKVKERWGFVLPVVFDIHHHTCFRLINHGGDDWNEEERDRVIGEVLAGWKSRKIRPEMHISEQGEGRIGHHSDLIEIIPSWMLSLDVDLMVEAKLKELAVLHLYSRYPQLVYKS